MKRYTQKHFINQNGIFNECLNNSQVGRKKLTVNESTESINVITESINISIIRLNLNSLNITIERQIFTVD